MPIVDDQGMPMAVAAITKEHDISCIAKVRIVLPCCDMLMLDFFGIISWPEPCRTGRADQGKECQDGKCDGNAGTGPQPTCQWIGQEPAGVAERELGCEKSRPIARMRRSAQEAP